jgi:hypothetical protein
MAKGKKDKGKEEELEVAKTSGKDADIENGESDAEDEGKKKASGAKEKSGILKGIERKWLICGILVFILIAGGAITFLKPGFMNLTSKKHSLPPVDFSNDNLKEESLSPFFIPPSPDLARQAVRVDLTVIWDGLASVRFKSGELRVRAETYDYLKAAAEKTEDLNSQKAAMEEEIGAIFRKSLGVNDLAIRIKELKVI